MKRQNREWGRGYEERRHHSSFTDQKYETCRLIKSFRLWDTNKYETFSTCSANLLTSEKSFRLKEKIFGLSTFTSWFLVVSSSNWSHKCKIELFVCASSAQSSLRSPVRVWHSDTPLLVSPQCPHITPCLSVLCPLLPPWPQSWLPVTRSQVSVGHRTPSPHHHGAKGRSRMKISRTIKDDIYRESFIEFGKIINIESFIPI